MTTGRAGCGHGEPEWADVSLDERQVAEDWNLRTIKKASGNKCATVLPIENETNHAMLHRCCHAAGPRLGPLSQSSAANSAVAARAVRPPRPTSVAVRGRRMRSCPCPLHRSRWARPRSTAGLRAGSNVKNMHFHMFPTFSVKQHASPQEVALQIPLRFPV